MKKGFRKLTDFSDSDRFYKTRHQLKERLKQYGIDYYTTFHGMGSATFVRYYVMPNDMCLAKTILMAIQAEEGVTA